MLSRDFDNSLASTAEPQQNVGTGLYKKDMGAVPEQRKLLVAKIIKDVVYARDVYYKDDYKQMAEDMQFAYDGAIPEWVAAGNYIANIVQRHVSQKTASLYAKNPRAVAKRKQKMDFEIWDEDMQSLIQAYQLVASGIHDLNSMLILQDYQRGMGERMMINRIGKTLEIIYHYFQNEQNPTFKSDMKQLVRRTITTGVGYVKSGYQRVGGMSPDTARKIFDHERRLRTLERMMADSEDSQYDDLSPEIEEARLIIQELQADPDVLLREGPVKNFPMSTAIIPDPKCTNLVGFKNCDWVAEEYHFTGDQIKEICKVDVTLGGGVANCLRTDTNEFFAGLIDSNGDKVRKPIDGAMALYRCWEVYNIKTNLKYFVCEGYHDFLEEPSSPDVEIDKFWPWEVLMFNQFEHDKRIFPRSDVFLMRDQQMEINRQREGLRNHRVANRPKYISPRGALEEEDKDRLENHEDSAVIEINNMKMGQNSADIVQPMKMVGIDPNLYDVSQSYDDLLRVIGSQETDFGGTSNSTATEASIGASSRMSSTESNRDDLDILLSNLARTDGNILFAELTPEDAKAIAGRGAVWPMFSREERAKELYLDIEAGSSGKPNQAMEVANFEKLAPLLMQIPGIKPDRLAKEAVRRLDDRLDVNEFIETGMPSINAQNKLAGTPQTGGDMAGDGTDSQEARGQAKNKEAQGAGGPGQARLQNQLMA
ncbi:MAG: hypothetical protein V4721_00475 [Bacteroidota bacterium]